MNISVKKNILIINQDKIVINDLIKGKLYSNKITGKNELLLLHKYNDLYICVYILNNKLCYVIDEIELIYKSLVKVYQMSLHTSLNKKKLSITSISYIYNPLKLNISNIRLFVTDHINKKIKINEFDHKLNVLEVLLKNKISIYKFSMKGIINDETTINNKLRITINVDDTDISYSLNMLSLKRKNTRLYYVPIKSIYVDKYAMHLRKSGKLKLILVKRLKEDIEYDKDFLFKESFIVSHFLNIIGSIARVFSPKKVNLCFEKLSEKAEEGTFELCEMMQKSKIAKSYYIIDEKSTDYERIKNYDFVVKKYSWKYYYLIYRSNNFITAEAPLHVNILRANNKCLRKSLCNKKFVFLQHGITYLKSQTNGSFIAGRESEPHYILASSIKEQDAINREMNIDKKNILITGLLVYDKVKYNSINNSSKDIITIMLTWKPYEEHLTNFEESSYYKNVIKIYNVLKKYIFKDNIRIISHPKADKLLRSTNLASSLFDGNVSTCMEDTKLLITDYSSISYNAFYRGSGVIFYQDDLEYYEKVVGKLIPAEDEYIGYRAYNIDGLENIIKKGIVNKSINLNYFRTKKMVDIYSEINKYHDGNNQKRVYKELERLKMV